MVNWTILLATAAVEKTAEGGLFDFDATLPIMAIQFVILVALLNTVFYKPLGKAMDLRAEYIRLNLAQAKEKKAKAKELVQKYELELKEIRRKSQEIVNEAQSEAQKIVAAQIQEAQQQVQAEKRKAAEEIQAQKALAFQSLEQQVESVSKQILAKILSPELLR